MSVQSYSVIKRAISKIPLLRDLPAEEQARLSDELRIEDIKKGTSIILSNREGQEIMFVADGAVDVKRSSFDGREVIVSRLGVGEVFGEISLLTEKRRSADVTAAEDCMVIILLESTFERLLATQPGFTRALLVHLAHRVSAASTRIADLALLDVSCRVFQMLRSIAVPNANGELVISERPTHKDLAAMVGTSREMVTRILKKLEDDEIIFTDEKTVRITGCLSEN